MNHPARSPGLGWLGQCAVLVDSRPAVRGHVGTLPGRIAALDPIPLSGGLSVFVGTPGGVLGPPLVPTRAQFAPLRPRPAFGIPVYILSVRPRWV